MTIIKTLDKAGTAKLITSIGKRAATLTADIHLAACSAMQHHKEHGDITLMNTLLLALPKSQRRQAVAAWAMRFGSVALNDSKETKKEAPLVHVKGGTEFNLELAHAEPFYELKAVEGADTYNVETFLASIATRLTNAIAKGGDEKHVAKMNAALKALQDA